METYIGWDNGYVVEFDGDHFDLFGDPVVVGHNYHRNDYLGKFKSLSQAIKYANMHVNAY